MILRSPPVALQPQLVEVSKILTLGISALSSPFWMVSVHDHVELNTLQSHNTSQGGSSFVDVNLIQRLVKGVGLLVSNKRCNLPSAVFTLRLEPIKNFICLAVLYYVPPLLPCMHCDRVKLLRYSVVDCSHTDMRHKLLQICTRSDQLKFRALEDQMICILWFTKDLQY